MAVEVETSINIECPRTVVAAYVSNPDNATEWYVNIKSVDWETPRLAVVGSRVAFVANFLGRRIAYTYEVRHIVPDERFVMSTAEGPFPMQTTYAWRDSTGGGTIMTLRNEGEPTGRYLSSQVRQFDGQVFCSSGWGWLIQDCSGICGGAGRRANRSGCAA